MDQSNYGVIDWIVRVGLHHIRKEIKIKDNREITKVKECGKINVTVIRGHLLSMERINIDDPPNFDLKM